MDGRDLLRRRSPDQTQISISLPRTLVERIDKAATAENRNRSNFIATVLQQHLGVEEEEPQPAKVASKPSKPESTPAPVSAPASSQKKKKKKKKV